MRMRLATSRSRTRSTMIWSRMLPRNRAKSMPSLAQPLAQLRHRQLVLRRHVGDRPVDLGIVDPRAALARVGDQHALVDQRVEHLLAQRRERRQGLLLRRASSRTRASRCSTSLAVTSSWLTTATM